MAAKTLSGRDELSPWVRIVFILLLLNAVPAFFSLNIFTSQTKDWFVWTILPDASVRLLGVMYGNAVLIVLIGLLQPNWAKARITVFLITYFSIAATVVTFLNLTPFLQHPWYHLAYWLTMYLLLFVAAPGVLIYFERREGGRLPVTYPLTPLSRAVAAAGALVCGVTGLGLLIDPKIVTEWFPWMLTPLAGRIFGVWFTSIAVTYVWAFVDGDWERSRPIFWQAIPTGLLIALVPLIHSGDIKANASSGLAIYFTLAIIGCLVNLGATLSQNQRKSLPAQVNAT